MPAALTIVDHANIVKVTKNTREGMKLQCPCTQDELIYVMENQTYYDLLRDGQKIFAGIIFCMHPANERWCYNVTGKIHKRSLYLVLDLYWMKYEN